MTLQRFSTYLLFPNDLLYKMIQLVFFLKLASFNSQEEIWRSNFAGYYRLRQLSINIYCSHDNTSNKRNPKRTEVFSSNGCSFYISSISTEIINFLLTDYGQSRQCKFLRFADRIWLNLLAPELFF